MEVNGAGGCNITQGLQEKGWNLEDRKWKASSGRNFPECSGSFPETAKQVHLRHMQQQQPEDQCG